MNSSHPAVHPIEVPQTDVAIAPRVRMKDYQGMPGTLGGLSLRLGQFCFSVAAFAIMLSIDDFSTVTAFWLYVKMMVSACCLNKVNEGILKRNVMLWGVFVWGLFFDSTQVTLSYFVAATVLQCLWSLCLAVIDGYALLVKRSLRNSLVISLFVVGDGVTGTLTFAAACASAGITVLIGNDLRECDHNHCAKYETATAMAFLSWFMVTPSFLLTYWLLATR